MHRQARKNEATQAQVRATVQWAEEVAKSERPSVMDGIGAMP
jgi:hypothetical protein